MRWVAVGVVVAVVVLALAITFVSEERRPVEETEGNVGVLVGFSEDGSPVYVKNPMKIVFVDRISGEEVNIPVTYYAEAEGKRITLEKPFMEEGWKIYVRTPYEILESTVPVIGVYTGWYIGKEVKVGEGCFIMKRWRGENIPVGFESGVYDPDVEVMCIKRCEDPFIIEFNGRGWLSIGDERGYFKFMEGENRFEVCEGGRVKLYVDGYKPWIGEVERNTTIEVNLQPLKEYEVVEGDIIMDSTGALAGRDRVKLPPGAYRVFNPFPFYEKGKGLPLREVNGWVGYKWVTSMPVYTLFWNEGYYYVLEEDIISAEGLLCKGGVCREIGEGTPILYMGRCSLLWDGTLYSPECEPLEVKG